MNPLARRRVKPKPAEQRKAEDEARRQIAVAVSIAERKAREETQAEVLEALASIKSD